MKTHPKMPWRLPTEKEAKSAMAAVMTNEAVAEMKKGIEKAASEIMKQATAAGLQKPTDEDLKVCRYMLNKGFMMGFSFAFFRMHLTGALHVAEVEQN